MAIFNTEKKIKLEEKRKEMEKLKLQSDAIAKLYQNKKPFDNSKNTKK